MPRGPWTVHSSAESLENVALGRPRLGRHYGQEGHGLVGLIVVGFVANRYWDALTCRLAHGQVPSIGYTDVSGAARRVPRSDPPTVVGFWITNCAYSERVMSVLNDIRQRYPEGQIDVVAFFLNPIAPAQLRAIRSREGYRMIVAPAQPPVELVATLDEEYGIHAPGRDIYVVARSGRLRRVDASDWDTPQARIESQVVELIERTQRNPS